MHNFIYSLFYFIWAYKITIEQNSTLIHKLMNSNNITNKTNKTKHSLKQNKGCYLVPFVVGLIEAQGQFVKKEVNNVLEYSLILCQPIEHFRSLVILKNILKCGQLNIFINDLKYYGQLIINNKQDLINKIYPLLELCPLQTNKQYDCCWFYESLLYCNEKNYTRPTNHLLNTYTEMVTIEYFSIWQIGYLESQLILNTFPFEVIIEMTDKRNQIVINDAICLATGMNIISRLSDQIISDEENLKLFIYYMDRKFHLMSSQKKYEYLNWRMSFLKNCL